MFFHCASLAEIHLHDGIVRLEKPVFNARVKTAVICGGITYTKDSFEELLLSTH